MNGWIVLAMLVISGTVIGVVSIVSYAAWAVFTDKGFQEFLKGD